MKRLETILCIFFMAVCGLGLAFSNIDKIKTYSGYKTATASTIPYSVPVNSNVLPLDIQLYLDKRSINDCAETVDSVKLDSIKPDTVVITKIRYVPMKPKARAAAKRIGDSIPAIMPDEPAVKPGFVERREEQATDSVGPPNGSIILIVDDKEVYRR